MEGELQTVYDNTYNEQTLQQDQQKPEERVLRSRNTQCPVLEYTTFTRVYNHNSTYLNAFLKKHGGSFDDPKQRPD